MVSLEKIKLILEKNLSEKRWRHSLGVAMQAEHLAEHYGADAEKAYLAGLVHDCAKEIDEEKTVALLREKYAVVPDAMSLAMPRLLHGPLGACMAQSEFGIYDPEVLDAIRYHTTGKANMSMLAKILYIADYIEPNRDYDGVDELRKMTYENMDKAILFGIDYTINDLIEKRKVIHPDTIHCRNDVLLRLKKAELQEKI